MGSVSDMVVFPKQGLEYVSSEASMRCRRGYKKKFLPEVCADKDVVGIWFEALTIQEAQETDEER